MRECSFVHIHLMRVLDETKVHVIHNLESFVGCRIKVDCPRMQCINKYHSFDLSCGNG